MALPPICGSASHGRSCAGLSAERLTHRRKCWLCRWDRSGEGQESGCTQGSVSKPRELKPATLEGCCVNSFPCPLGPLILGQVFHRTPLVLALGLSFSHLPGRLPCCHTFSELPPFLCLTASPHPVCLHSHVTPCMQVLVSLSAWGKPDSDRSLGDF